MRIGLCSQIHCKLFIINVLSTSIPGNEEPYLLGNCIAVMEAMASGCHIVTSDLGALPETTAGFAHLIPMTGGAEIYKHNFYRAVVAVVKVLQQRDEFPLRQMVDYINEGFTRSVRSLEWVEWLHFLKGEDGSKKAEKNVYKIDESKKRISHLNASPLQLPGIE